MAFNLDTTSEQTPDWVQIDCEIIDCIANFEWSYLDTSLLKCKICGREWRAKVITA